MRTTGLLTAKIFTLSLFATVAHHTNADLDLIARTPKTDTATEISGCLLDTNLIPTAVGGVFASTNWSISATQTAAGNITVFAKHLVRLHAGEAAPNPLGVTATLTGVNPATGATTSPSLPVVTFVKHNTHTDTLQIRYDLIPGPGSQVSILANHRELHIELLEQPINCAAKVPALSGRGLLATALILAVTMLLSIRKLKSKRLMSRES